MKRILTVTILLLNLAACATSSYSVGKPFPSDQVATIKKGETTTTEILAKFGEPFSKSAISATQEKWLYSYVEGSANVNLGQVKSTGTQKTLDLLLDNEIVVNYTFTEGPVSTYMTK